MNNKKAPREEEQIYVDRPKTLLSYRRLLDDLISEILFDYKSSSSFRKKKELLKLSISLIKLRTEI